MSCHMVRSRLTLIILPAVSITKTLNSQAAINHRATFFHSASKPRWRIHVSNSARSIWSPDTASIERMSRKCFSDPLSRYFFQASAGRIRTRPGSAVISAPAVSSFPYLARTCPHTSAWRMERNPTSRMIPAWETFRSTASSPKSLSSVTKTRPSRADWLSSASSPGS